MPTDSDPLFGSHSGHPVLQLVNNVRRRGRTVRSVRELGLTRGHREESLFVAQFITNAIMNSIKIKLGVSLNKYSGYAWHDLFYTLVMS